MYIGLKHLLFLGVLTIQVHADTGCPPASFSSIPSALLSPSATTHRVLLPQGKGYTAFEMTNASPYSIIRTIPNFATELSPCAPPASGVNTFGVYAVGQLASGGY